MLNCSEICWIVLKYFELFRNMLSCSEICWIVQKYVELFWNMLNCSEICWIVLKYVELCWNILNCSEICKNFCTKTSQYSYFCYRYGSDSPVGGLGCPRWGFLQISSHIITHNHISPICEKLKIGLIRIIDQWFYLPNI